MELIRFKNLLWQVLKKPESPVGKRLHAMAKDISAGKMKIEDLDMAGMPSEEHGQVYKNAMFWLVGEYKK